MIVWIYEDEDVTNDSEVQQPATPQILGKGGPIRQCPELLDGALMTLIVPFNTMYRYKCRGIE